MYNSFFSGQVENENMSLFNYSDNSFGFYNNVTIRPSQFISDLNATELQSYVDDHCSSSNINVTETCGNTVACIVDTVATCDVAFGERTKQTLAVATENQQTIGICRMLVTCKSVSCTSPHLLSLS